jgi:hypothetical protein
MAPLAGTTGHPLTARLEEPKSWSLSTSSRWPSRGVMADVSARLLEQFVRKLEADVLARR